MKREKSRYQVNNLQRGWQRLSLLNPRFGKNLLLPLLCALSRLSLWLSTASLRILRFPWKALPSRQTKTRQAKKQSLVLMLSLSVMAALMAQPAISVSTSSTSDAQHSSIEEAIAGLNSRDGKAFRGNRAIIGDSTNFAAERSVSLALATDRLANGEIRMAGLAQGQRHYEAGELTAALESWQQVATQAPQPLLKALAWSYVSLAAQDLGDWTKAEEAIARSLSLLADAPSQADKEPIQAQVLNVQGRLNLKKGQPEVAWEIWQQAEAAYAKQADVLGQVGAQINQAQALQTMGLYRRANVELTDITAFLKEQPDSDVKAIALMSLGNVFQTSGNLEQSRQQLEASLALSERLGNESAATQTLFSLANTLRLLGDTTSAQQRYEAVASRSPDAALRIKAQLNHLRLLLEAQQWPAAQQLLSRTYEQIQRLPASREAIYSRVNLAEILLSNPDAAHQPLTWLTADKVAALLQTGAQQAQTLQDDRAQSLALGELSRVYGHTRQWSDSQALAQRAITLAQDSHSQDIAYRWQRQLGKVYHQQGKDAEAIASYTDAVTTLKDVRRDLLATNSDVQYSFRETVEPIYRELVNLLLLPDEVSQQSLSQARETIEGLQLAELENYFKSACIDSASEYIDKLDSSAAVLYPIILSDRIEVIVSMPNSPLRHYRTWQSEDDTNQTIVDLFQHFNPALSSTKRLRLSKQIYDWLISPIETDLGAKNIETLVFVLDGQFRSIPMAALYDGEQYLLEKYSVALTPGLKLLGPHFQSPKPLQALMLGLSEARDGFSALPGVKTEIEQISARVNTEVLFDQDFTKSKLATEIDKFPFPVLHVATHGQFSSQLDETFLLAWDQRLTLSDLDDLLNSRRQQSEPIELMVLSACQTAEGDDRATLGLAGMAIRSGARSTLATLWAVNDESTAALMTEFYQELSNAELSKAQALRKAQIKILQNPQFSHPFYWSPFVLIGNWLS
jgi:CHAT domain-containing protein